MHDIWSLHNWRYGESLRILAPSLSLPFLGLCVGKYGVRWVFSAEFPSVWRCQLAAACRGGFHSWSCYGYLLVMPESLRLLSNLQGTSSQAHLGDEFDNYQPNFWKFMTTYDHYWNQISLRLIFNQWLPVAGVWSLKSETKHLSCYLGLNIATFSAVSLVRLFWVPKLTRSLLAV